MFGFKYCIDTQEGYIIEFDTHDILCSVLSIVLILSIFYVLYQDIIDI